MADLADNALAVIERHLTQSLARHRLPEAQTSADECADCGEEIPAARRAAAPWSETCIDCQSLRERRQRHVR